MGNVTSNPTKKIDLLVKETNDFSANVTNTIIAEAKQNVLVSQQQNIVIQNTSLSGCSFTAEQDANVIASQTATFKATLSSPKKMLKQLTEGPNSIFGQAFASNSTVMSDFLKTARESFGKSNNTQLRKELTNIIKINISQTVINRAIQNIQVDQTQNVLLSNFKCTNSTIKIKQNAAVNAMQTVMVQIVMDSLGSNPTFRKTIRDFNGEYDPSVTGEQIDANTKLPEICAKDLVPVPRENVCPKPLPCPECEDCLCDAQSNMVSYQDYILSAQLFYIVISISVTLIVISILLK